MRALAGGLRRLVTAVTGLFSAATAVQVPHTAEPHHTDRNVHCECWGCQRTKANRRRALTRSRRLSRGSLYFGPPKLTGVRLQRVTAACDPRHLIALPRYARPITGEDLVKAFVPSDWTLVGA